MGGISLLDFIFISRAQRFYIIIAAYQFNHYIWPVLTKLQEDARLPIYSLDERQYRSISIKQLLFD